MPILTKEQFEDLSRFNNTPAISIYLPTQRLGKDVLEEKDKIQLKSQWKKIVEKLKDKGLHKDKIDALGKPLVDLLEDRDFWRHQSDGLAIFLSERFFRKYTLPVKFEPFTYIADHFYLKPLVPMCSADHRFYILEIQVLDSARLFEASEYKIREIDIQELTPERLEDAVGYDYEQKTTQHRSTNSRNGVSTAHGQGPAEKEKKNEYLRYFRAVDKGLHEILKDERAPLLVACQEYLFPIYREANTYKELYPEPVPGNPSDFENIMSLHAASLKVLEPRFKKEMEQKMTQFREMNPGRTATSVSEILPAIYEGKVDTLFIQNREDIWGNYNENMASVEVQEAPSNGNVSLLNLAAIKVIEQGGKVYLIEDQFMPSKESKINAVFRY